MFDSIDELQRQIQLGEDSYFELKEVFISGSKIKPERKELSDEIAAFGNTNGGVILLGVNDKSKDITGIPMESLQLVQNYLKEIFTDIIKPPINPIVSKLELPDSLGNKKIVFKIDIPKSLFVHKSANGYFYRNLDSKKEMLPEHLARLFQQRSQARLIRFEEQAVPQTSIHDLDEDLYKRFISSEGNDFIMLQKRGLLVKDETASLRCSVAGILMCSKHPERFLESAFIEAVAYRGYVLDSNEQIDAKKITGSLDMQIEEAFHFFKRNTSVSAFKNPDRKDLFPYSERAIFEGIVNAIAHRDYSIYGSKIRFFLFKDRIQIYSPGDLPNTLTLDTIELRQSTRNELITNLLSNCPVQIKGNNQESIRKYYMEKRGEGVPIIMAESFKLSNKRPVYVLLDNSELLLTIFSSVS